MSSRLDIVPLTNPSCGGFCRFGTSEFSGTCNHSVNHGVKILIDKDRQGVTLLVEFNPSLRP